MNRKEGAAERNNYLELLDRNTASFKDGNGKNVALLGTKKSGKTSIVKEHLLHAKDVSAVYVDLSKISLNPENFSVEFIGNVAFSFLKKPLKDFEKFQSIGNLLNIESELKSQSAFSLIKTIQNELLKIKPDQRALVQSAFNFAKELGNDRHVKFLIALDNIENLFDLNNFSQIKDVLSLIDFGDKNVSYIATSSAIRESLELLKQFECFEIKNLDKKEAMDLAESIIGKDKGSADEIWNLSKGQPFVTRAVSKRFNEIKDARKSFLIELLQKDSPLYDHCNDSYNYYYNRARGQTLLKTILKVIANDELRLSEIAKRIYRSAPVTKSMLERLIEVDIIYKKDNKFYFSDDVLRLWVKLTSQGYDFDETPDDEILDEAAKRL